ncbi:MAG TPA: carboxypeptidase M32 [Gaiellaceae bacterium]|nr:carboxypeptidase M32 [Gaiellaceae bacterium]
MGAPKAFDKLKIRLGQVTDLRRVQRLLAWDMQVLLPPAGATTRAEQQATIDRVAHELFTSPETGRLLDQLRSYEDSLDRDSDDASLIRVAREDYEKAVRVPVELRSEMVRAATEGFQAWREAKPSNDFEAFRPYLEHHMELRQRYVECFPPAEEPYDVLLDDYERGMRAADVRAVFERLKEELVPLIAEASQAYGADDGLLGRSFPKDAQVALSAEVVELFGHRKDAWRIDPTLHPFASGGGIDDIRITTKYEPVGLESLFATMHEYGHGLYEHQVAPELERTPLGSGVSLGLHESQSRMWENLVGRSRGFWRFFYPRLQAHFPEQLADVDEETWYRTVNRVQPSLIRIAADEVTYNMHVILRFELEQDLLAGTVPLTELPTEWNQRMYDYLGVEVTDDAHGVLQDMHWGTGTIGYFPTYALGNVMSVQIWDKLKEEIGDLEDQIERGEFAPLREWLGENIHRHGRKFGPQDTLERAVGSTIDPDPYLKYLREKHGAAALA